MTEAALLARAERVIDGPQATALLGELRDALEAEHGRAMIYEIVPPSGEWIDRRAAMLSDYLDARRYGPIGGPSVQVAVWSDGAVYVIPSTVFFAYVAERRGVTLEALTAELRAANRAATN